MHCYGTIVCGSTSILSCRSWLQYLSFVAPVVVACGSSICCLSVVRGSDQPLVSVACGSSICCSWLRYQLQWLLFQWLQWLSIDSGGCRSIDSSGCRSSGSSGCRSTLVAVVRSTPVAVVPVAPVAVDRLWWLSFD